MEWWSGGGKSHFYEVTGGEVIRLVAGPLLVVAGFCVCMTLGVMLNIFPSPRGIVDMDRTIVIHQVHAARHAPPADILLLGDSSCLMDVSAADLSRNTRGSVLNLGTVSYLGFDSMAQLLREYAAHHPDEQPLVTILLHPFSLRRPESDRQYMILLKAQLAGRDYYVPTSFPESWFDRAGFISFRDRLLTRWLGWPLSEDYAAEYGLTTHLWRQMTVDQGSLRAAGQYRPHPGQGSSEFFVSKGFLHLGQQLKEEWPKGYRLAIGITPIPHSFEPPDYTRKRDELLSEWAAVLQPDRILSSLPAVYPDNHFASVTHLNARGATDFTRRLADELCFQLGNPLTPSL